MKKISEQSLVVAGAVICSLIAQNMLLAPILSPHLVAALVELVGEGSIVRQANR